MDGNFAMSPTQFAQLFVIQVALSESAVPCDFALLQDKRQTTYETLFQAIIDKCTNLGYQPDPISVMVDFEIGLRQALSSVLGDHIHIQGCFYHLSQATWRKIQELGLTDTYKNSDEFKQFCGMLDGLAFLPVRDVDSHHQTGMFMTLQSVMPKGQTISVRGGITDSPILLDTTIPISGN